MFQDTLDLSVSHVNIPAARVQDQTERQNYQNSADKNSAEIPPPPPPVTHNVPLLPENVYKVIQWQTEQILILKEQVRILGQNGDLSITDVGSSPCLRSRKQEETNFPFFFFYLFLFEHQGIYKKNDNTHDEVSNWISCFITEQMSRSFNSFGLKKLS